MEAVATTGGYGFSIVNNSLQRMLTDEVKIAFDNATGNEIFFRKYKVEKFEGRVGCIVKDCKAYITDLNSLRFHCIQSHSILLSTKGIFILQIQLTRRKIYVFDMNSEDVGRIKYLPESGRVSNDRVKEAGIIGESSCLKDNNDLQYRLKDEVISAFKNYKDDNNYGGQYKVSIVDNEYDCIIKGCDRSYKSLQSWRVHCRNHHNIRSILRDEYIIAIEKTQDNINATKTTTDNMASTRKRSHSPDIHEEESNAKKAMLNPSESGYLQSALSRSNYNLEPLFWHDDLLSITEYNSVDDTLVTGNNDLISNDVQPSATSKNIDDDKELLELARELAENNSDFQDALNKDVADKYATSRDSYL